MKHIPFNKPFMAGNELRYIQQVCADGQFSGNGKFTKRCQAWLEESIGCGKALLTHSCTAALEMAAILIDIKPGDEIIMPSYTFVSTANAFVLRGGIPVLVDIREDTLNLDEKKVERVITGRTKAIVPMHYAGTACEMGAIMDIARRHNLAVIEDAAHGIMAKYKESYLGSIGDLAALSFHETKNIISGEGGALLINDKRLYERAEIIWEKGTNRSLFLKGQVDKYSWVDIGSSYLPNEITAAFLWAQLEKAGKITQRRLWLWSMYQKSFLGLEMSGVLRRQVIRKECAHNAHMYYLLLPGAKERDKLISFLKKNNITAPFHYVPLHLAAAGRRYCRIPDKLPVTEEVSQRLLRLPLWAGMKDRTIKHVIDTVIKGLSV